MTRIGFLGLGSWVPERVMTNEDWAQYVDTSDEWIRERTGIRQRHIALPEQTTVDFAEAASRRALEDAGLGPEDVDEILVATDTPQAISPDTAAFLQHRLGTREVPAYDLAGSGCAGYLQALDVARARVALRGGRILVVAVELISRFMDWHDRATCVLFGDAAGAAVVGREDAGPVFRCAMGAARTGTDGAWTHILGNPTGGTARYFDEEVLREKAHRRIHMDGREVFRHAVARMSEATRQVLADEGRSIEDLDLFVPHQANLRILAQVARNLGLPEDKLYVNVQDYGNTGSASVPLALDEARRQGRIPAGSLVGCAAFGAGFHWGALLLHFEAPV